MSNSNISSIKRIGLFILAISIALGVVYSFSFLGHKTRGPLVHSMEKLGDLVYDIDYKISLSKREDLRKNKLQWFSTLKKDKDFLINPNMILFGGSDVVVLESFENTFNLEDSLDMTFPLLHIYKAWGKKPEEQFPMLEVKTIIELGSIPIITWEPWLVDFDDENKALKDADLDFSKSLLAISLGIYDEYIRNWARDAKSIDLPIYLRFAHEMNDAFRYPWATKTNLPTEFIAAWRHVHQIFKEESADNIIWVWSPHIAYSDFNDYYPGDKYVDVVGTTILNYGTVVDWSQWWSFKELFGDYYPKLEKLNKPIMISEFGCLAAGGDPAIWFKDALMGIYDDYPLVRSVVFYQYPQDESVTRHAVNWRMQDHPTSIDSVKSVLDKKK